MSLLFDVWLVTGLIAGLLDDVLADTELNGDDFGMYSLLRRFGPATPTQLHRWTGLPPTTISAHLKRLETVATSPGRRTPPTVARTGSA